MYINFAGKRIRRNSLYLQQSRFTFSTKKTNKEIKTNKQNIVHGTGCSGMLDYGILLSSSPGATKNRLVKQLPGVALVCLITPQFQPVF